VCASSLQVSRDDANLSGVREIVKSLLKDGAERIYQRITEAVEQATVAEALRHTSGNQVRASELLGISRMTLRAKLKKSAAEAAHTDSQPATTAGLKLYEG